MVQVVQPYSSTDMTTAWKKCLFSLSVRSDFHMTDSLFEASHAFPIRVFTSLSVDEILLPRYMNCSTGLRGLLSSVEMCQKDYMGTSGCVMVSKVDWQTMTSEFEPHWVLLTFGLVPYLIEA